MISSRDHVGDGAQETLVVLLEAPGNLEVSGTPRGATVDLTGPKGFKAKDGLPLSLSGALRGTYNLRVHREGYRSFRGQVTVEPAKTTRLEVRLKRGRDGPFGDVPLEVLKEFRRVRRGCTGEGYKKRPTSPDCKKAVTIMREYKILRCAWPNKKQWNTIKNTQTQTSVGVSLTSVSLALGLLTGLASLYKDEEPPEVPAAGGERGGIPAASTADGGRERPERS